MKRRGRKRSATIPGGRGGVRSSAGPLPLRGLHGHFWKEVEGEAGGERVGVGVRRARAGHGEASGSNYVCQVDLPRLERGEKLRDAVMG